MTTARWRRIEEIYQAAADLDPRERADLLKQTCGTDGILRQEIENLLAENGDIDATVEAAVRTEAEELAARESESANRPRRFESRILVRFFCRADSALPVLLASATSLPCYSMNGRDGD